MDIRHTMDIGLPLQREKIDVADLLLRTCQNWNLAKSQSCKHSNIVVHMLKY